MKLSHTTRDNQKIEEGTRIYYTGDMANIPDFGIVKIINPCDWYGLKIHIKLDDGREFALTPSSFEPGPGTRFITEKKYFADRNEKLREAGFLK